MLNNPSVGFHFEAAYTVPGVPWLTASLAPTGVTEISLPYVPTFISLKNLGPGELKLAFSRTGFQNNRYATVSASTTFSADLRACDLYLSCSTSASYEVLAGLTFISRREMPTLSGSWEGVG